MTTKIESANVIALRMPLFLPIFSLPQLLTYLPSCDTLLRTFMTFNLAIPNASMPSLDTANVVVELMILPILHALPINKFPMQVMDVRMIGCRSAHVASYSGNANRSDANVAIAAAVTKSDRLSG